MELNMVWYKVKNVQSTFPWLGPLIGLLSYKPVQWIFRIAGNRQTL